MDTIRNGTHHSSCPKGPPGKRETEITSRASPPGRSLRALLYPAATASRCRPRDARRDVTGIPVSVLPSGGRRHGPPAVDPSLPIRPADQPARLDALEAAVRDRTDLRPELGIVLGSGLGDLAQELT